jgi:copper(I)-binding protein
LSKYLSAMLLCGLVSQAALATDTGGLTVDDAWVRALPPGQPNTAAYLTVTNAGDEGVTIVGGTADIAGSVEIHTTRQVDGYQRMEQLSEVALAAGQSLIFSPGGMHLMLLELQKMPAPGDRVQLCLTLAAGEAVCTSAEVRKSAGSQQSHEHHKY